MKSRLTNNFLDGEQISFGIGRDSQAPAVSLSLHQEYRAVEMGKIPEPEPPSSVWDQKPYGVYIPENYEPNYPYPLLIWLHRTSESERELASLMEGISSRNYMGMGLQVPLSATCALSSGLPGMQSPKFDTSLENKLHDAVRDLRSQYHIHSERVYLAGFDNDATLALQLLLSRPEWFAGAVVLNGRFPSIKTPLAHFRELAGKRVLLSNDLQKKHALTEAVRGGRLLYSAGMEVATRTYDSGSEMTGKMLKDVNHWLMEGICSTYCV